MADIFGLTAQGFVPKRQQDIIAELQSAFQAAFGQNVNLLPESVFGQLVGVLSEREALIWQLAEAVYDSQFPSGAEGTSVDNILALNNLKRLPAAPTKTNPGVNNVPGLVLYGTTGTTIPAGSLISVYGAPNSQFSIDADAMIGSPANAVQTLNFTSTPASGAFNLEIVDSLGNGLTSGSVPWNVLAHQSVVNFASVPGSGYFVLSLNGHSTANILFSDNAAAVQGKIQAVPGFSAATVSGSYASGFTIDWGSGNFNPIVVVLANTLGVSITTIDSLQGLIGALRDDSVTFSTTGNTTLSSNQITSVASVSGIVIGQLVTGTGIPGGTVVTDIAGNIVTISANATANGTNVAVVFTGSFPYTDVSVTGTFGTGFVCSFGNYSPTTGNPSSGNQPQNLFTVPVNTLLNSISQAVNVQVVDTADGIKAQAIASATCTVNGPTYAPAHTLTVIDSPVSGWTSVDNPLDAIVGNDIETDTEALTRRHNLLAAQASGPIQAIVEKVQNLAGVTSVLGFENLTDAALQIISFSAVPVSGSFEFLINTQNSGAIAYNATSSSIQAQLRALVGMPNMLVTGDFTNGFTLNFNGDLGGQPQPLVSTISNSLGVTVSYSFGRPGKSFEIVVDGGTDQDIAEAIYDSKPAGIQTYGNQNVTITDAFGNPVTIYFSRPTVIPIYINVSLTVSQVNFPLDGIQTIQNDLVSIGSEVPIGGLIVGYGTNGLIGAFNSVPGIVNYTLLFGTTNTPVSNSNIQLQPEQLAQFSTFNIAVTISYV